MVCISYNYIAFFLHEVHCANYTERFISKLRKPRISSNYYPGIKTSNHADWEAEYEAE